MKKKIYVGVDWAKDFHAIVVVDENGTNMKEFTISHTPEGIEKFKNVMKKFTHSHKVQGIAIETPRNLIVGEFIKLGYKVYAVNPRQAKRYREGLRVAPKKTDMFDAYALAHMLKSMISQMKPIVQDSMSAKKAVILTGIYEDLTEKINDVQNQLNACLKAYYPAATKIFCKLAQDITIAFLREYPTPQDVNNITIEELTTFLKKNKYTRNDYIGKVFEKLKDSSLQSEPELAMCHKEQMLILLDILEILMKRRKDIEMKALEIYKKHPDNRIFLSLPSTSDITATRMFAMYGDNRLKFDSHVAIQAQSGTAPVTRESGTSHKVVFRQACNKSFRNLMHQFARNSIPACFWANNYFNDQLAKGKTKNQAIRSLANKWHKIIFKLWKTRQTYDESKHLLNQQKYKEGKTKKAS